MKTKAALPKGLLYYPYFINRNERADILKWLSTLYPLWEMRFSEHHLPPENDEQRPLLRPVYWLGNWQFACLNYYHPPQGVEFRCLKAEPYPKMLQLLVDRMEFIVRKHYHPNDVPKKWKLNTCLINFYGDKIIDGAKNDRARVGEHKDFEPGPVASLSIGERAFFQFVNGVQQLGSKNEVFSMWLEDSSLQIFGGDLWKKNTFHRVQRVENKRNEHFDLNLIDFDTRRINFTFRYVPEEHVYDLKDFPANDRSDIDPYLVKLAENSSYYSRLIK
jgi:alkylated DNA repair protein (DNA oxidative demethylase)